MCTPTCLQIVVVEVKCRSPWVPASKDDKGGWRWCGSKLCGIMAGHFCQIQLQMLVAGACAGEGPLHSTWPTLWLHAQNVQPRRHVHAHCAMAAAQCHPYFGLRSPDS